ncbi:MAG TPA: hypothetical protein DCR27_00085 [Lachnospiraceae bacterium]|nr:hypothetical protein [Lachnospiraceae bacterium]
MGRIIQVSVIMCVYNEEPYMIEEAVQSVIDQTFQDWELIIVYDNPENLKLKEYLLEWKDERIRFRFNDKNIGAALSRNAGIKMAKGEYIAILDSDDVSERKRLEKEVRYILCKKCDLVCSAYHCIDEKGRYLKAGSPEIDLEKIEKYLPYIDHICHSTVLIRKEVYLESGGYRPFRWGEDYDLWLRLLAKGYSFGYIAEDLLGYRVRSHSITTKKCCDQAVSDYYIRKLYRTYIREKKDIYSVEGYEACLKKYSVENLHSQKIYARSVQLRREARECLENGKYISTVSKYACAVLGSRIYRLNIYNSIRFRLKFWREKVQG